MKINGLDKFRSFIEKASKLVDTSEFYAKTSIVMLADVKRNFKNKKNSDGSLWAPLKFRKGQPLKLSAGLFNSISRDYDSREAKVGTNKVYAAVHNYGYKFKPTKKQVGFFLYTPLLRGLAFASIIKIPRREYMFLSKEGGRNVEKATTDTLEKL